MVSPSVAQWDERHQEIVLKNDPGRARQGVEVERNRAQTRIALTNDVDRPQQGVFKGFSFFLALGVISPVGHRLSSCSSTASVGTVERCLACEAVVNRETSHIAITSARGLYRPVIDTGSRIWEIWGL
jgi:hypothetical protein